VVDFHTAPSCPGLSRLRHASHFLNNSTRLCRNVSGRCRKDYALLLGFGAVILVILAAPILVLLLIIAWLLHW